MHASSHKLHASVTQTSTPENFLSTRSQTGFLSMLHIKSLSLFLLNNSLCGMCERMLLLSLHALLDDAAWIQIHEYSSSACFPFPSSLSLCIYVWWLLFLLFQQIGKWWDKQIVSPSISKENHGASSYISSFMLLYEVNFPFLIKPAHSFLCFVYLFRLFAWAWKIDCR